MNKKTFMIQAVLSACCIITSCSSDTVNGDKEYFTRRQITYVQEDESLKSASNLNGNLNCSKELEHYSS